jgi:peroxiredoxin
MKMRGLGLLGFLLMIGMMAGVEGRATKDNVGTHLPDLHLEFSGDAPQCQGRPLLVEFWSTSCNSCRESVSHLNSLYGKFKARGLEAVGVTDDDEATVKAFEKDFPISYAVGHDRRGRLATALGVVALPHAMLVDKGGKIVWEGHPLKITEGQLMDLVK